MIAFAAAHCTESPLSKLTDIGNIVQPSLPILLRLGLNWRSRGVTKSGAGSFSAIPNAETECVQVTFSDRSPEAKINSRKNETCRALICISVVLAAAKSSASGT